MSDYRYEIKYILDMAGYSRAQSWMLKHSSAKKAHPSRFVNSVYFDDPGYSSVRDNLAGISDRKKLRLRWYHNEDETKPKSLCFEMKYRHGRLGRKDKFAIKGIDQNLMDIEFRNIFSNIHDDLGGDNEFLNDSYLSPTLHVSYHREYFEGMNGIRVTFDQKIRFFNPLPHAKPFQSPMNSYPHIIMEIKFPPQEKDRLVTSLRKFNLTPKRHSKYLAGLASFGLVTYV